MLNTICAFFFRIWHSQFCPHWTVCGSWKGYGAPWVVIALTGFVFLTQTNLFLKSSAFGTSESTITSLLRGPVRRQKHLEKVFRFFDVHQVSMQALCDMIQLCIEYLLSRINCKIQRLHPNYCLISLVLQWFLSWKMTKWLSWTTIGKRIDL